MSKDLKKILYCTGVIEPHREGISKEVFALHKYFNNSFVIGVSPDSSFKYSHIHNYLGIPRKYLSTHRYWSCFVEKYFSLLHIYQGIDNYHYLKANGNKPLLLTAVSVDGVLSMDHYKRVCRIIVECNRDKEKLVSHGFNSENIIVIYPGTDLFLPDGNIPPSDGTFKILFASSPFSLEYMEARGVRILLEAAKIKKDVEFILLWRQRGNTFETLEQWVNDLSLENVSVVHEDIKNIGDIFLNIHATILPFTTERYTKSCPNSAVESIAMGRPVLVSDKVGIADIIKAEKCGLVFKPNTDNIVDAINNIQKQYYIYQNNALKCAKKYFDQKVFIKLYDNIYNDICKQVNT